MCLISNIKQIAGVKFDSSKQISFGESLKDFTITYKFAYKRNPPPGTTEHNVENVKETVFIIQYSSITKIGGGLNIYWPFQSFYFDFDLRFSCPTRPDRTELPPKIID